MHTTTLIPDHQGSPRHPQQTDQHTAQLSLRDLVLAHPTHPACRSRLPQAMLDTYAAERGCEPLTSAFVRLAGGTSVQIDGVDAAHTLLVLPITTLGPLTEEDRPAMARRVFALNLASQATPGAEPVLLFATAEARDSVRFWTRRLDPQQRITLDVVGERLSSAA